MANAGLEQSYVQPAWQPFKGEGKPSTGKGVEGNAFPPFPPRFVVIVIDSPGHGRSQSKFSFNNSNQEGKVHSRGLNRLISIQEIQNAWSREQKVPRTSSSENQRWWHLTDCHSTTFNIIQGLNTTAIVELLIYALLYSILYSVTKYLGHDPGVPLNTSYAFYLYIIIV